MRLSQVDRGRVESRLTPSLRYACCYWVYHVEQAGEMFADFNGILAFLREHLLHWFEALSLLEKLPEAVHALRSMELLTVSSLL